MATFNATFTNETQFNANFKTDSSLSAGFGQITMVETGDYENLANKPKINGETVVGEKIGNDYKLQDKMDVATVAEIEAILYLD